MQLQDALQLQEHTLLKDPNSELHSLSQRIRDLEKNKHKRSHHATVHEAGSVELTAEANLTGSNKPIGKPTHPPADRVVSKV